MDGAEDRNGDGAVDAGETQDPSPGNAADDGGLACQGPPLFEVDGAPVHGLRVTKSGASDARAAWPEASLSSR